MEKHLLFVLVEKHLTRSMVKLDILARAEWRMAMTSTIQGARRYVTKRHLNRHEEYQRRSLDAWLMRLDRERIRQVVGVEGVPDEYGKR